MDICKISGSCRQPANEDANQEGSSELPSIASPLPSSPVVKKSRGLRIDPAYFYVSHSGQSVSQIADRVVATLKRSGVDTIYLYAYSSVYGAFYPTNYDFTSVEPGYGALNIFAAITAEAHAQGLKVVAVIPLNNFKLVWENNSSWRVKDTGQVDYKPHPDIYPLSPSVNDYKNWYEGFVNDLVTRNPLIDGLEAVEPTLDFFWTGGPDQNSAALKKFNSQFPGSHIGSQNWLNFRSSEFINFIAFFNQTAHSLHKESYLVHTWTAASDGSLMNNTLIKNNTGFDFIAVATLSGKSHTDHLICELIWQQWFSEYGSSIFNSEWIKKSGTEFINILKNVGSTSDLILHVEISTFSGSSNTTIPTKSEFAQTMLAAKSLNTGLSVYDYNQIHSRDAFAELALW